MSVSFLMSWKVSNKAARDQNVHINNSINNSVHINNNELNGHIFIISLLSIVFMLVGDF